MLHPPLEQPELTAAPLLLLVGGNHSFLANQLAVLASQPLGPLVILIPTDEAHYSDTLGLQVVASLKRLYFQRGYYHQYWHFPKIDVLEINSYQLVPYAERLQSCRSYFLNLDTFSIDEEHALDMELSPAMTVIQEQLENWGMALNEELLSATVEGFSGSHCLYQAVELWAETALCAEQWSRWAPEDVSIWEAHWGATYRYLQDLQLWQYQPLYHTHVLHQLAAEAHQNPAHWPLQATLLLYKRFCSETQTLIHTAPQWFQVAYEHYQKRHNRHIEILPKIEDDTVTILISTFNRLQLLKRAVTSVLNQTYPKWKLIIGDGGSTDGTKEYGEALAAGDARITYVWRNFPKGSRGLNDTQRLLLDLAETEWVVIVCDDDWLDTAHLSRHMELSHQYPWAGMVFGCFQMFNNASEIEKEYGLLVTQPGPLDTAYSLIQGLVHGFCPQACLYRRSLLRPMIYPLMAKADESGEVLAWDYIFTMHCFGHFTCVYIPEVLFYMFYGEASSFSGSHTDFSLVLVKVYEVVAQAFIALFDKPYPPDLKQAFIDNILRPRIMMQIERMLQLAVTPDLLESYIQASKYSWLKLAQMAANIE